MLNTGEYALSVAILHYYPDRNQQREMVHFISNCQCGVSHTPHLTFTCITGPCNYSRLTRTSNGGAPTPSPPSQAVSWTEIFPVWSLRRWTEACWGSQSESLRFTHADSSRFGSWSYSPMLCLIPHLVPVIRSLRGGLRVDLFTSTKKICYRYHRLKSMMVWVQDQGERDNRGRQTEKVRYRTRLFHIKS